MKDIYFEPGVSKPNFSKKVIHFATHWLTICSPFLSVKVAGKLLGNPFSRRVYEMRTGETPSSVMIETSLGDLCLHKFVNANADPDKNILLCHGWGDSSTRFTQVIDHLMQSGFTVYSLDQIGHGKSAGSYSHLFAFVEGTTAALNYLALQKVTPLAVVGHSMGALGVMNLAPQLLVGKKIILISAPALFFENMYDAVASVGIARSMLDNLLEKVSATHKISWQDLAPHKNIAKVDQNFLFIHDTTDQTCPYSATQKLLQGTEHEFFTSVNLGHVKLLKDLDLLAKIADFAVAEVVKR
ncbi:MAG: alpha/beta hydrolase [Pseudomonadales bacterium]|nr:alpha/beta hydrolase [Pseudomonadales bacterium]NRA17918.1 alpha/beta fold hydrolase [Oceanospirillaceae bacterium]